MPGAVADCGDGHGGCHPAFSIALIRSAESEQKQREAPAVVGCCQPRGHFVALLHRVSHACWRPSRDMIGDHGNKRETVGGGIGVQYEGATRRLLVLAIE